MAKILVSDSLSQEGLDILEAGGENTVDYQPDISAEDLLKAIPNYEALVIRSGTQVTAEVLRAGSNLKIVGRAGVGVDNVDIPVATECGIMVANAPDGNTITTCEHAISLMVSLVRNVPRGDATMKAGEWAKKQLKGVELFDKILGVIGLGKIGREVIKRMQAFGMDVWGYDPYVSKDVAERMGIELKSVEEIVEKADIITIHTPKTPETTDLIGAEELKKMKKTAFIVNCARGGIVNEEALVEALEKEEIAGAAVDVYSEEPLPEDHPLRKAPHLVLTPHLGASTAEAQEKVATQVAAQVVNACRGGEVTTALNAPAINAEVLKQMGPSLEMAEKLGSLLIQMADSSVTKLEIAFSGSVLDAPTTEPLFLSILKGYLEHISDMPVNFVNARPRMEAQGVEVIESHSSQTKDYLGLQSIKATMDNGKEISVAGTVFEPNIPRVVMLNNLRFEMQPEGEIIMIENIDRPGVIGKICTELGDNGINIGEISWGRDEKGGTAMTAIHVDNPADAVIKQIRELESVLSARLIKL